MKKIAGIITSQGSHWVGDGFPVRNLISYNRKPETFSPFLLLDFAGPHQFAPAEAPRGVELHPHRGFETVTIVYEGEVAHRDSRGHGGIIGAGDVQWMTAASGILHEEMHSENYTKSGGPFQMIQLWVNLPAKDKMTKPTYQALSKAEIPTVDLASGAGRLRVIAGEFQGTKGPAKTFTPLNMWDVQITASAAAHMSLPEGHTSMMVVISGKISVNGSPPIKEAEIVVLERHGTDVAMVALEDSRLLVLTGEPINEPVVGRGPFVMNSLEDIAQAYADYRAGHFSREEY